MQCLNWGMRGLRCCRKFVIFGNQPAKGGFYTAWFGLLSFLRGLRISKGVLILRGFAAGNCGLLCRQIDIFLFWPQCQISIVFYDQTHYIGSEILITARDRSLTLICREGWAFRKSCVLINELGSCLEGNPQKP